MRAPLSVTIVTLNEEKNLTECLEGVLWAEEIVVVDAFSTDRTVEIAREYTDRVLQNPWPGFVQQKNFALDHATHEWVLNLDADERVSPALRAEIEGMLRDPAAADGYDLPRKNIFLGRWMLHGGWYPDRVLRLFRKSRGRFAGIDPHARVRLQGRLGHLGEPLLHITYRSLSQYLAKQYDYTCVAAQERIVRRGPQPPGVAAMAGRPLTKFVEGYLVKRGFLDGFHGLLTALFAAYFAFIRQAKIRELSEARGQTGTNLFPRCTGASDLDGWFAGFKQGTDVAAANQLRTKRPVRWWDIVLRPAGSLLRLFFLKGRVQEGAAGFISAGLGAFFEFTKYAKMWESLGGAAVLEGKVEAAGQLPEPGKVPGNNR